MINYFKLLSKLYSFQITYNHSHIKDSLLLNEMRLSPKELDILCSIGEQKGVLKVIRERGGFSEVYLTPYGVTYYETLRKKIFLSLILLIIMGGLFLLGLL